MNREKYMKFTAETATLRHLADLQDLYLQTGDIIGDVVEFGSFEGRSSLALAEVVFPGVLHCVDTWNGGIDGFGHDASAYNRFLENMAEGDAVFEDHVMDMFDFCEKARAESYKFIYLDASHDYESVKRGIAACLPLLVKGGILAGDDFLTASRERTDLHGGVQRAVEEAFESFEVKGNLWWITRTE
jgi:predicted O-methyltransferase YrrM